MSDGRKRILSPFTGRKEWKAWNKTREKYVPVKRRQSLVETGRGSYYKQERLQEFWDSKFTFYNGNESDKIMMRVENNEQQHLPVFPILLQNSFTNSSTTTN